MKWKLVKAADCVKIAKDGICFAEATESTASLCYVTNSSQFGKIYSSYKLKSSKDTLCRNLLLLVRILNISGEMTHNEFIFLYDKVLDF